MIAPIEGRAGIGHSPVLPWADPAQHLPAIALQTSVHLGSVSCGTTLQAGAAVIGKQLQTRCAHRPPLFPIPRFLFQSCFAFFCPLIKTRDASSCWRAAINMLNRSQWKAVLWGQGRAGFGAHLQSSNGKVQKDGRAKAHRMGLESFP